MSISPVKAAARWAVRCAALLLAATLQSQAVAAGAAVYQVTVPLAESSAAGRNAGFAEALKTVAVRVSGSRDAASNAVIAKAASSPSRYVQQYGSAGGSMLRVGFDGPAIEELVLQAGYPIWPAERPVTLVLVETAAGPGRVLLAGEASASMAALVGAAEARGIELVWPRTSTSLGSARARAQSGDVRELALASAGAPAQAVLIGTPEGSGFSWQLFHDGPTVTSSGSAAEGAQLAADAFAARFATPATRGLARVPLTVGNIAGLADYAALLDYLQGLSFVREAELAGARQDLARLSLTMRGDMELLRRVSALGSPLAPATRTSDTGDAADAGGREVDFIFMP
jgi:hypothetical protein